LLDFEETPYPCEISYMEWPCNYFTQLDNAVDPAHVSIAHWHFRTPLPSRVVARENECGLIITADGQGRKKTPSYVHMPNAHEWGGPPRGGKSVWNYARGWRVPLDDYHHARFGIEAVAGSEEEARERWVERTGGGTAPEEVAEEVLAGRMSPKDLDVEQQSGPSMTNIQDYIALVGLGPIADQPPVEHLGRADVAVVALRNLFVRELRALAEGRPLMEWKRPERLWKEVEAAAVLEGSS
jgi:5,5'-dehydrodivanillate O-demethylase